MSLPCTTGDLIPQQGKMGFEQILVKVQPEEIVSTAVIGENHIFLDDCHRLANPALVEYINQLIAAVHGYQGKLTGKPVRKGLFVGLQDAEFYQEAFLGDQLTLKADIMETIAPVSFIHGIIERNREKLAEFVTKLYEVEDALELDKLTNPGDLPYGVDETNLNFQNPPMYIASDLRKKLYTYIQDINEGDDFVLLKIACPSEFDAFDGHFPGNPLLPGIVLLEIGRLALELLYHQPVLIRTVQKMKIGGVILPGQPFTCVVKIEGGPRSDISFSAAMKDWKGKEISRYNGTCIKEENNDKSKIG